MTEQMLSAVIRPKLASRLKSKQVYVEACQVLADAQIATVEGNKNLLVDKVRLHLRRAEKYHFISLALGLSRFLQSYYTYVKQDKTKATQYKKIREKYIRLSAIEELIDLRLLDFTGKINSKKYPHVFRNELNKTCIEFKEYLNLKSAPISIRIYSLNIILAYLDNDYNRIIALCRQIINWLESKGFGWYAPFYYYLVPACIIQKRFEEGRTYIKKAMGNVNRKSNNWNTFAFARFLLEMHAGNYQEAYIIYKKIERKKIENSILKERWMIAKAYLNFLIQQGEVKAKGNFKLTKFLNEVPISNMDKAGNNVDIIILSIIHRYQNDRMWIIDRKEAIDKYMQRYLDGRSKLILKMLLSGIRNNFDPELMEVNNWKHMEQLMKNKDETDEILAFEIIPFERLWGMVLSKL